MKILVIGAGGREHAIGWKLSEDRRVKKIYFAPGNGGTSEIGVNVDIQVDELEKLLDFAIKSDIDLTVVGPELPLTLGVVDKFRAAGRKIFGPDKHAAQLEGSKAFAKEFMLNNGVPTAGYNVYTDVSAAVKAVENTAYPLVIKADGIAAGKGVIICEDFTQAKRELEGIMTDRRFGTAGETVVIEEFLRGMEASVICFTDGKTIKPMVPAQDYKRALDGDMGLNTGGMGSVTPAFAYTERHERIFTETIMKRTLAGMNGMYYRGVLYFGLMIDGESIKVIEYNARFGDPETEAVLLRLKTPLLDIIEAVCAQELDKIDIRWEDTPSVCVIAASEGYPGEYKTGFPITIGNKDDSVRIFHAGTSLKDGQPITNGGRVLAVCAAGESLDEAREKVYNTLENIHFNGMQYRKDIGK